MRFDPFVWDEVKPDEKVPFGKGRVRVRCSAPAPCYVEAEGVEALAGVGTEHDFEVSEPVTLMVTAPEGVRVFVQRPVPTSTVAEGEVYTNADRMPYESGALAEVTRARRMFELERRAAMADIRRETAALKAARVSGAVPAAEPASEPVPDEPVVDSDEAPE